MAKSLHIGLWTAAVRVETSVEQQEVSSPMACEQGDLCRPVQRHRPARLERRMAGPSSPIPCTANLGMFLFLVLGQSSPGRTEMPPPESWTPQEGWPEPDNAFQSKALLLASLEPEYIKCFTQGLDDLICFFEENKEITVGKSLPYHFYYQMEGEEEKACTLSTQQTSAIATYYICFFPLVDVTYFSTLTVRITAGQSGITLHQRSLMVDKVVLLDPPSNVSVNEMSQTQQLVVNWLPPKTNNLQDSIMYEINFSSPDMDIPKVKVVREKLEFIFTNVESLTQYTIAVRAKPDGVSFNGYWSAWSKVATVKTSNGLDTIVLVLTSVLLLSALLLSATVFLTLRRFLKRKIWPVIPDPSNHFEGLFTIHNGNFQQWLGRSSVHLWGRPNIYNTEGLVASLEVLSELSPTHPGFHPSLVHTLGTEEMPIFSPQLNNISGEHNTGPSMHSQMPPLSMDSYIVLGENFMPRTAAPDGTTMRLEGPVSQDPIERQESVGTLSSESSNTDKQSEEKGEQDSGQSGSCSSGLPGTSSTEQTSSSSFEYALVDPVMLALSTKPSLAQNVTGLKYPYLMVSDSGVSTDYSSMNCSTGLYSNTYENDVRLGPFLQNKVLYCPCGVGSSTDKACRQGTL